MGKFSSREQDGLSFHGFINCARRRVSTQHFSGVDLVRGLYHQLCGSGNMFIDFVGPTYFIATAAVDRNKNSSVIFKMQFNAGSKEPGHRGRSCTVALPICLPGLQMLQWSRFSDQATVPSIKLCHHS
jgi:hypothetical protein